MFRNYLAAAIRNLTRNGPYAGITIAGLAIAFAAAILIGLYVRDELSYDHWVPGHERIYLVQLRLSGALSRPITEDNTSAPLAPAMKLEFPQIEYAARFGFPGYPPSIRRGDVSQAERAFEWADPDFFKIFRVAVVAGDAAHALEPAGLAGPQPERRPQVLRPGCARSAAFCRWTDSRCGSRRSLRTGRRTATSAAT